MTGAPEDAEERFSPLTGLFEADDFLPGRALPILLAADMVA